MSEEKLKGALDWPHMLIDEQGRLVSCKEITLAECLPPMDLVNCRNIRLGELRCKTDARPAFLAHFHTEERGFPHFRKNCKSRSNEMLTLDLEALLQAAAVEPQHLDRVLYNACLQLRTFSLAENCSVFGLPDQSTFTGLMAVTPYGIKGRTDQWNTSMMNIATIAIQQKKPYICQSPAEDPNFQAVGAYPLTNLISFPILYAGIPIGLINVSNKLDGPFTHEDLYSIQKIAATLSPLLCEEFERERGDKFLNTSANLGRYLSKSVVRQIASSGTSGDLGGTTKKVVVLFSDIRSFSTISEKLSATKLVELLNFYFEEMSEVIEKYNGTLDKLVGDLMMVLWNVPNEQPDAELLAVKCGLEMQKTIAKKVAARWADAGIPGFGAGIGINAGNAVAGNLGSKHFMNYTVIGNSVNAAQRLEARAKAGEVIVHESIFPLIDGKVPKPLRKELGIKLKGIADPVNAYVFTAIS